MPSNPDPSTVTPYAKRLWWSALLAVTCLVVGCRSYPPIHTVDQVDLRRFAGDWYVISHLPTFIETEAYNAVETYEPNGDVIDTTFRFNKGSLDGPEKVYEPTGFICDESNAVWGMQFIWPIKADFRICYLNEDYSTVVVGRTARDYVWVMSRTPQMDQEEYAEILRFLERQQYDLSGLRLVPHDNGYRPPDRGPHPRGEPGSTPAGDSDDH
ncbi:MAG: lipocalin family protein [Planctomycetota bacterium]